LREIAGEKLGILRPGVPVVIAAQEPDLAQWLPEQARARGAPVSAAESFRVAPGDAPDTVAVTWSDGAALTVPFPAADLTAVKRQCAATALAAVEAALGPAAAAERIALAECALATRLPGRLERRTRQRVAGGSGAVLESVILDGGHNAPALLALAGQLRAWGVRDYTLIFGMQGDKLVAAVREPLGALLANAATLITLAPQTARAPSAEALNTFIESALAAHPQRPQRFACADARAALDVAAREPRRPLVVTGSFWMLGDVMRLLEDAPSGGVSGEPAAQAPTGSVP
jgi:dihydrofolate synthase/folylpolyglutamate synthase